MDKLKDKVKEGIQLLFQIQKAMDECNIRFGKVKIEQALNPYYNQIEPDSCLVIEDYYGIPHSIYTPIGYLQISSGYISVDNHKDEEKLESLMKDFGFEFFIPPRKTDIGIIGGWRKNSGEVKYRENSSYIPYDEAKRLFKDILKEEGLLENL